MKSLSREEMLVINRQCDLFEQDLRQWRDHAGEVPKAEDYAARVTDDLVITCQRELIPIEMEYRAAAGQTLLLREYQQRFPEIDDGFLTQLLQESVSDFALDSDQPTTAGAEDSSAGEFSLPSPGDSDIPNQIGQYEINGKLGGGGMGTVYRAVHKSMQRNVAIKVMRADSAGQDELRKRFRREVLAAAKLVHPNVVTAYDAGEVNGRPYLVTELIDGIDLKRHVANHGPLGWREALACIRDAARGLEYAHENSVIHRDIKPANLLIDQTGSVKILDLGLARLSQSNVKNETEQGDDTAQLTSTGVVMGTASYMAPEQARQTRSADARSDIYSLGCVLYFLLSGNAPYRGESVVDTILAHVTSPIPTLDHAQDFPATVVRLMNAMMAKDPDERPQRMSDVLNEISSLIGEQTEDSVSSSANTTARAPAPQIQVAEERRSKPEPTLTNARSAGLVGLMALLAGIGWAVSSAITSPEGATSDGNDPGMFSSSSIPEQVNRAGAQVSAVNRAAVFTADGYIHVPSISIGPTDRVTVEIIVRLDSPRLANPLSWHGQSWMTLFYGSSWGVSRYEDGASLFTVADAGEHDEVGVWHHIAGTWDGSRLHLFIDGKRIPQKPISYRLQPMEPGLFIGGVDPRYLPEQEDDRFFVGAIDAVRIVQRVIYSGEQDFRPPEHLEPIEGTLLLMQLDEPPGTTSFHDASGNGHHGVGVRVGSERLP